MSRLLQRDHEDWLRGRCNQRLFTCVAKITEDLGGADRVGGRVWLLPAWLLGAHIEGRRRLLSWAELTGSLWHPPKMVAAAILPGPVDGRSSVNWTVGKGMVGGEDPDADEVQIIQHATHWPTDIDSLTETEWRRDHAELARGRSLEDVLNLRSKYGTVVGVGIQLQCVPGRVVGCLTIHTKAGEVLTDDEVQAVSSKVVTQARLLAIDIENGYLEGGRLGR